MVQESPVVYRSVLGRKSKRIYQNLPHRGGGGGLHRMAASLADLLDPGQRDQLEAECGGPSQQ